MPIYVLDSPVFLAVAWPTADGVTGIKPRLPAGRGLTLQQGMISAGAEAIELRASLAQRHLPALAELPRVDGFAMASAQDQLTAETTLVPAQHVYLDSAAALGEPLVFDATSTGCAAGPNRSIATATALWECVERDAVALWWHGGLPAGALSLEMIDQRQPRLFWWLAQRERSTLLLDLTTDIDLPVVAAVSANPDGRHVAVGTAARPFVIDAALAAVTEMIQTEVSMDHARQAQDPELLCWDAKASIMAQSQFQAFGVKSTLGTDLTRCLADLGHRVLALELTLPGDPLPSMRVLVPGLCAMGARIKTKRFQRLCPDNPDPYYPEPF